ncbi:MAG TPA: hypothetical protein VLL30_26435 [Reyranella sp.]|nr:hypothetical protein [Reyranella sp.]
MPDGDTARERTDELVEKIGAMLKESHATNERTEKIKIGIQIAQFIFVGIVGTAITFYADRIKSEQERHNQEIARSLQEDETKAAKAKVILEFIPALSDPQDKMKPKIALQAIEKFIDIDFAQKITVLVNTPAIKEGFVQIQDERQAKIEPVPGAAKTADATAATPDKAQEAGWVYLGNYDPANGEKPWQTQYFVVQGQEKEPNKFPDPKMLAGKTVHVTDSIGMSNLRSDMPRNGVRLEQAVVLRHVKSNEMLKVVQVEAVLGTKLYWARVTPNGA